MYVLIYFNKLSCISPVSICIYAREMLKYIVVGVGIEPISLAFQASVLTITPCKLLWCHHYTHNYLYMQLLV